MFLLDTCVISETVKPKPSQRVLAWLDEQPESSLFLSALTFGELSKGIAKLASGAKRDRLHRWVEHSLAERFAGRVLMVDRDVAVRWGVLCAKSDLAGRPLPVIDSLLAATALAHGMKIVTRNVCHLLPTGVEVVDPWRADDVETRG